MRIHTILRLAAIALPVVMVGCTDNSGEVSAVYGDEPWTAGEVATASYERGKKNFAEGLFGMAVRDFEEALVRDPRSVEALNGLAATYDRLGRFEQSERYYLRALSLDPNSVQSLNNLGYSYLMQRRYDLAMTYLRDASAVEPANAFVAQNIQKVEAASDLVDSDFMTAPVQAGWFEHYAGSAPRTETLAAAPIADADLEGEAESEAVVHIVAHGASPNPWIERTAPVVQSLVTQPSPEIDLAVRDWGVKPALANYRPRSALEASANRRIPWEVLEQPADSAALEASPVDLPAEVLPTAPGRVVSAPLVEVKQVALAPADELAAVEMRPMNLLPDMALMSPIEPTPPSTSPMNLVPAELLEPVETQPETLTPIDLLPMDFMANADFLVQVASTAPAIGEDVPLVEVSNGTGRESMALRMGNFLEDRGFPVVRLMNAEHFEFTETTIYYRDGWLDQARRLTAELPAEMLLEAAPDQAVDIHVRLGGDLLIFDRELLHAERKPSNAPAG